MAYYRFFQKGRTPQCAVVMRGLNRRLLRYVRRMLGWDRRAPHARRVLEVGVGIGDMQQLLRALPGVAYVGLDVSRDLCRAGRLCGADTVNACVPGLPFRSGSFDAIYFSHVIEHLRDYSTVLDALQEMHDVLAGEGRLFVLCPDYSSWREDFWEVDYSHAYPMGVRRMHQLAADAGFAVETWTTYRGPFLGAAGWLFGSLGRVVPYRMLYRVSARLFGRLHRAGFIFNRNLLFVLRKPAAT